MAEVIANYRCEWKVTLETPEMRERFRSFVNTDQPDPSVVFVRERDQIRPAPVHVRLRSAVAAGSANRSRVGPAPSGNLSTQGGHS
jgi:nitrite reductase (NADH) large subunit